jgi:hypothetical protein
MYFCIDCLLYHKCGGVYRSVERRSYQFLGGLWMREVSRL